MHHSSSLREKWHMLSLAEQLGNTGSEVSRMRNWQGKDKKLFQGAFERALELIDLTAADPRWRGPRLKEILRARELLCDAVFGGKEYKSTLEDMDRYFFHYALAARAHV